MRGTKSRVTESPLSPLSPWSRNPWATVVGLPVWVAWISDYEGLRLELDSCRLPERRLWGGLRAGLGCGLTAGSGRVARTWRAVIGWSASAGRQVGGIS